MSYNIPDRIKYVERHTGPEKCRRWALKTARIYRRAVLGGLQEHERRLFIQSYLALKNYALRSDGGGK